MTSISSRQNRADNPLVVPRQDRLDYRGFVDEQTALPDSDTLWGGGCESLQRTAHGFPARFGSAFAHQIATPKKERLDPREAPFSAFVFCDDPNDDNAFGHVVGKWRDAPKLDDILVSTNDVADNGSDYDYGNVTVVPLGYFPAHWGDGIRFATLWFGPDEIPTVEQKPKPRQAIAAELRDAVDAALDVIQAMSKAIRDLGPGHPVIERRCRREITHQHQVIEQIRRLLP